MNVAFEPWIPVVDINGRLCRASLLQILSEGYKYADLAVRPHERVALMRLLICVAHACLGGPEKLPDSERAIERLAKLAEKYLMEWKESFEVFHLTKPWLQIPDIKPAKGGDGDGWTSVSKLALFLASGNNSTLFDHDGMSETRHIDICDTLVSMLTFQCFSPGGLMSQVHWGTPKTGKSSKDGLCVSSSMLHTLIRRNDLSKTLQANMPTYSRVRRLMGMRVDEPIGRPVWEHMPKSMQDLKNISNATNTYLGRLVPIKRLILLNKTDNANTMIMGDGLDYPSFSDNFPHEPTATVLLKKNITKKEERVLLAFRPEKGTWRELPALLAKRSDEKNGLGGSLSIDFLKKGDDCDLIVSGVARNQGKILDTSESLYHIQDSMHSHEGLDAYEEQISIAEHLASKLEWAVDTYRKTIDSDWVRRIKNDREAKNKLYGTATIHFWTSVEANLNILFNCFKLFGKSEFGTKIKEWQSLLYRAVEDSYTAVCGQDTPRQLRAFIKGWEVLHKKGKITNNENTTQEYV
jgi:CRISPR system Cascade subunit CasA